MSKISIIMKQRRKQLGMSAEIVAEKTGLSAATIYRYESGDIKNMGLDKVELLANALNCSPAYLMGWEDGPVKEEIKQPTATVTDDMIDKIGGFPYNPTHRIPILGYISAGLPLYAEEHIEGYTYTELNSGGEYFGLRVKGDSMNAANIHDGNVLIVRRQPMVENGEIAAVMVGDEDATVKRFYQDENIITLMPQSNNPKHLPQIYNLENTKIKIIGKVVRNQIDFD